MSIVTPERPVDAVGAPAPSPRRTWWHAVNSVIAIGAVTVGVIALTRDPATKTVEVKAPAAAAAPSNRVGPGLPREIPSDYAAATAMSASGGVPSDKYADRVPAYQYDIAKQHAPVSPTGPILTPDPSKTIVRR
jgi:hypothetical protein